MFYQLCTFNVLLVLYSGIFYFPFVFFSQAQAHYIASGTAVNLT